jgi:CRP-like cAMP-binding protein
MLKVIEKALLLQEVDALKFVSADHLMQLAEAGREESYKKGDMIMERGDLPLTIYLLLDGRATLEEDNNLVFEKTALNLCSGLAGVPYTYSCICLEDCTVLAIAEADLVDLMAGEPEFGLALLKYFASKRLAGLDRCL